MRWRLGQFAHPPPKWLGPLVAEKAGSNCDIPSRSAAHDGGGCTPSGMRAEGRFTAPYCRVNLL